MQNDPTDILARAFGIAFTDDYRGTFKGISLYVDPRLPGGTVEFRDKKGNVIGTITGVGKMTIGVP